MRLLGVGLDRGDGRLAPLNTPGGNYLEETGNVKSKTDHAPGKAYATARLRLEEQGPTIARPNRRIEGV